jgi:5-methylcytosine-specific restriction endonuclease McrA
MARDYGPPIAVPTFEASKLAKRARYNRKVAIWNKTGGYCWHCGCSLVFSNCGSFHMDHLHPKILGGSNKIPNMVPACEKCNAQKWMRLNWAPSQVEMAGA